MEGFLCTWVKAVGFLHSIGLVLERSDNGEGLQITQMPQARSSGLACVSEWKGAEVNHNDQRRWMEAVAPYCADLLKGVAVSRKRGREQLELAYKKKAHAEKEYDRFEHLEGDGSRMWGVRIAEVAEFHRQLEKCVGYVERLTWQFLEDRKPGLWVTLMAALGEMRELTEIEWKKLRIHQDLPAEDAMVDRWMEQGKRDAWGS